MEEEISEPRQRKKKLINEVKDLLEFYFSPVNVSKDKFMQRMLENECGIDIEIFHKFNKVKKLTTETKILRKAVMISEKLELSEDNLKVKPKFPLVMKENEMECTIYVENLPPNSNHDWLRKVFSLYGNIDYISLPRFLQSGQPKGFAFIEFHSPQEAQKALEAFGGLASLDGTLNPSDLLTIRTYNQVKGNDEVSSVSGEQVTDDSKKRKVAEAFEAEDSSGTSKKLKLDSYEKETEGKKKKKRKRNKKEKQYELDSVYLRVMAKKDWKALRNKYLNMQKEELKRLKQQIRRNEEPVKRPSYLDFIPNVIVKIVLDSFPKDQYEFRQGLTNNRPSIAYIDVSTKSEEVYVRFKTPEAAQEFLEEKLWPCTQLLEGENEKKYWDKIYDGWRSKRSKKKAKDQNTGTLDTQPPLRGREKLIKKALKLKNDAPLNRHITFDN